MKLVSSHIHSVERLTKLEWYTEGPVMDVDGNIYVTTLKGGNILKMDLNCKMSVWAKSPYPNGQVILPDGDHLICDVELSSISRFNKEGKFIKYAIKGICNDERVYAPNDLVVDSKDGIYFTDSIRENGKVFYCSSDGSQQTIGRNLDFPNGIAFNNDETILYVAESYRNRILAFRRNAYNTFDDKYEVFCELPNHPSGEITKNLPDGIKIDKNGNMLVAHYGMQALQVLSNKGKLITSIRTEFPLTSNLFVEGNTIIVTGGYSEPGPGGILKLRIAEFLNRTNRNVN